MITEDQTAVIDLLANPATYGGEPVDRVDTHASIVFLVGGRAYKLKRAVRYDYLDFSTAERRRDLCQAEVRLNRRTAPTLYRGVVAATRAGDGSLTLGGDGTPVDWVVEMDRFPQEALFDRLASDEALGLDLMDPLARAIAAFHAAAEPRPDHGGQAGMSWVVDGNAAGLDEFGRGSLDMAAVTRMTRAAEREIERHGERLETRRQSGLVRQCHGDLHLRNIVLLDQGPTMFDGIEFNEEVSCIDVLYDLAFLLMDLWRRQLPRHANVVLNRYLGETADLAGLSLLPLFLSCRAAVRAKTSVTAAAGQDDPARRREQEATAREYLSLAQRLLDPPPPCLIATGGFSGSGKSTLAAGLAPSVGAAPGALVLRSDEIRKRLCGVPLDQHLGPEGYTEAISERVYAAITEQARRVLAAGHAVIADAVYARAADRLAIERVAAAASVPFVGLWLDAPEAMLADRTASRRHDPSDATPEIVHAQIARGSGDVAWTHIDAARPPADVLSSALDRIRQKRAQLLNG